MSIKQKTACKCVTEEFADTQTSNKDDGNNLREMSLELDSNLESRKLINCDVFWLIKAWGGGETATPKSIWHIFPRSTAILSQGRVSPRKNTLHLPKVSISPGDLEEIIFLKNEFYRVDKWREHFMNLKLMTDKRRCFCFSPSLDRTQVGKPFLKCPPACYL